MNTETGLRLKITAPPVDNKANKFFGVDEDYEKDSFIGYNHEEENEKT